MGRREDGADKGEEWRGCTYRAGRALGAGGAGGVVDICYCLLLLLGFRHLLNAPRHNSLLSPWLRLLP